MVAAPGNWNTSDRIDKHRVKAGTISSNVDYSLLEEVDYLRPRDRCMIKLRFRVGLSMKEIGAITHQSPSAVSRRLSTVNQRLHDPIVQALQRHATEFDQDEREIAMLHFAGGQGVDRIAHDRRLPRRRVMTVLATVRGWHRHLCAGPAAAQVTPSPRSRRPM